MTTINKQIAASTDDGYEINDSNIWLADATMVCGDDDDSNDVGLRWTTVNIPQSATISTATLSLYRTGGYNTLETVIRGIDEDNTATWSAGSRPSQRTKTTATITANQANWGNWGAGNWITIDIATIVQEIVNRGGWSANNSLAVVVLNTSLDWGEMEVRAYDYSGNAYGAKLDVTYTASGRTTKNARQSANVHSGVLFQTLTSGHGY